MRRDAARQRHGARPTVCEAQQSSQGYLSTPPRESSCSKNVQVLKTRKTRQEPGEPIAEPTLQVYHQSNGYFLQL